VLESASAVVAISRYTSDLVRLVAPQAQTEFVPLAVDEALFSPEDRGDARRCWGLSNSVTVLLSVSRIQRFKGHDTVLQAIAMLPPKQRENLVYVVAGKGHAEKELRDLADDLDVADNVRWLGFVPEQQLPSLYRAADLFVLCTREEPGIRAVEGFGLVFLEAQSCGVPAIGTDCGGIPDAVEDGNGGWLVPPGDSEALAELLGRLVVSPGEIREMGELARNRVLNGFTWQQYARRLLVALERRGVFPDG
jgi:phosphatidylinositol alpha-1,6-mannosyltransferase